MLQAFHNDKKVKTKYLKRVRAHEKADEIIQGKYWEGGKGCAVGCTIHGDNHAAYEKELGIPQWLARLEDRIFEGLSFKEAKLWPAKFLSAINVGADLEKIKIPFLIFIVESAREKVNPLRTRQLEAIDGVLKELKSGVINKERLMEARQAAAAAAAADAAYAAYAADAAAAYAADAAYAAAAAAAADAAYAADARKNEYSKFANKLLELLKECK